MPAAGLRGGVGKMKAKEYIELFNKRTQKVKEFAALAEQEPDAIVFIESVEGGMFFPPDSDGDTTLMLAGELKIEDFGSFEYTQGDTTWEEPQRLEDMGDREPVRKFRAIVVGVVP